MKSFSIFLLMIFVIFGCTISASRKSPEFGSDLSQGERLYHGIVSMPKVDSYPKYAEVDSLRSAYYNWKIEFIKKYGMREWDAFVIRMKELYGEPKHGYDGLLDTSSM